MKHLPMDPGVAPGRPELLREVNARQLLRLLRLRGPCSRADLVRHSGLSAPTVSSAISYLQEKGLVEGLGPGRSNGGRRPSLLRFNPARGYVMGVDIGRSVVRVGLADLKGGIVEKWVGDVTSHSTPERVANLIHEGIVELQGRHRMVENKILALAAGVPGITCAVENDVNLAALGESWCGTARGVPNFVFLSIGTGVGAGIFVNGHLYHGSEYTAGEIGYLYVPGTEETPLALRRQGPLESVIGSKGIEQFWVNLNRTERKTGSLRNQRLEAIEIFNLAERGNRQARMVLQQTARILADAITNVCVILNSSLVVLGGRLGTHPALFEATRRILERNEFSRPQLAVSSLGREAQLFGALWLALNLADARILTVGRDGRTTHVAPYYSSLSLPVLGLLPPD